MEIATIASAVAVKVGSGVRVASGVTFPPDKSCVGEAQAIARKTARVLIRNNGLGCKPLYLCVIFELLLSLRSFRDRRSRNPGHTTII
jgi:hypothetical protein